MNTSLYAYSQEYIPPAPILPVSIAILDESPEIEEYEALVDTGADATLLIRRISRGFQGDFRHFHMAVMVIGPNGREYPEWSKS